MKVAHIPFSILALTGCTTLDEVPANRIAAAELKLANGAAAGKAELAAAGDKLTLRIAAFGLPRGAHGTHLHMVGSCEAPAFTYAGGHLNPAGHRHGALNTDGSHLGDLPNLVASAAGVGALVADIAGSRASAEAALFDADGTAIVVHADPDDYKTDPSGNSGTRIACGVLRRQ